MARAGKAPPGSTDVLPVAPANTPAATRRTGQRSLASYLLLPRPKDTVKWWILPLGFGLGSLAAPALTSAQVVRALVVWALLELLIYQARYQWNDVRGFA